MAVTPNRSESTKQKVVEGEEVHTNLTAKRPLQMRFAGNLGLIKRKRVGGGAASVDQTESLSDIDDSEIVGYLCSKEERHYKTIIWEKINQQYAMVQAQAKKQKKEAEIKKDKFGKGSANNTNIGENKIRSSKINYEALKQLTDELNEDLGDAEALEGSRSRSHENSESNAKNVESEDMDSDEIQEENQASEEDVGLRESNYELYDEYEDGYYTNYEDF